LNGDLYGVVAEFESATALVAAARAARAHGLTKVEAYTPLPIEEVAEALHVPPSPLPVIVLVAGLFGGSAGYLLQYWTSAVAYPLNVGGRPLHSAIYFIPITFECTVLAAALAAVFGLLALSRLPEPYHPLFNVPRFALASKDAFFLCVRATDPRFDHDAVTDLLRKTEARHVAQVPL
jgi:hypothetical protein